MDNQQRYQGLKTLLSHFIVFYLILSREAAGWAHISNNCLRLSLEGLTMRNFLHCLLHFHVEENCSLGPLLAGCTSVKNTVQIPDFRAMNLSGKENESWLLLFSFPQHLSRLFIRCKHLSPTSSSVHTHFTLSLECLHADKCWSILISHPTLDITCSALLGAQWLYWGLSAYKCSFSGTTSPFWPSPPPTDLAEESFYHPTQSLYIHRVFFCMVCWLLQL